MDDDAMLDQMLVEQQPVMGADGMPAPAPTTEQEIQIEGAQTRVGSGPELVDTIGEGATSGAARDNYATKIAGKVLVVGGNPRGLEIRVPTTVVGD